MTVLLPLVVPVIGALTFATFGWHRVTAWVSAVSAAAVLASAIVLAGSEPHTGVAGLLRVDALSAYMLVVIGAVALLATVATPAYFTAEITAGRATVRTATRHSVLVQLFLAAMALAVLAANLGVLWVAIEATTIVTAFLVGQRRTRSAVEAAWKYVVICSAGIALALLGTIVLNFASSRAPGTSGLDLDALAANASNLDPGVTRIAVLLLVLGFGTKAGLAPLHAWLPDAHSQAPAPVSALMSGVLLSVAFYAILRVKVIADAALGTGFTRMLLAVMAVASLVLAASLLVAQRDYKRMLAYSSIEHLGLVALGTAFGSPLALTAVLLHILGHGLAKGVLFLGAGRILQVTGSSRIGGVRGLATHHPALAGAVGLGVLALIGLPPFSLFASELGLFRAGFTAGLGWLTAIALVLVLIIAAALVTHTSRMLLGAAPDGPGTATGTRQLPIPTSLALLGGLVACAVLGVTAGPLTTLLHLAAETLVGAR
ncbi:hydrogenase-4 component F [Kibdelosporangium banguiense]|uniref:Hydrogenase-4 component F n=1 Tax=Kibdelosporangium banguiense TaxID=1365924 RepID=A0ABS4TWP5_9PSEU|nr:proton-conducting transporter membrane subunit [Kibdelosporangium banguiense]MBP2328804.1 hydrogenase-4 component F [Kibdelosporangium banguiense]